MRKGKFKPTPEEAKRARIIALIERFLSQSVVDAGAVVSMLRASQLDTFEREFSLATDKLACINDYTKSAQLSIVL